MSNKQGRGRATAKDQDLNKIADVEARALQHPRFRGRARWTTNRSTFEFREIGNPTQLPEPVDQGREQGACGQLAKAGEQGEGARGEQGNGWTDRPSPSDSTRWSPRGRSRASELDIERNGHPQLTVSDLRIDEGC